MSSFIEYGPLTKSSNFTFGNFLTKKLRNALASAAGSVLSAAVAAALSAPKANALMTTDKAKRTRMLLDLRCEAVGRALVVGPALLQLVALGSTLERKLHIRVLRNSGAPIGREHGPAVVLEAELLDVMGRDQFPFAVLDQTRVHRMLDQGLHIGRVTKQESANTKARSHRLA